MGRTAKAKGGRRFDSGLEHITVEDDGEGWQGAGMDGPGSARVARTTDMSLPNLARILPVGFVSNLQHKFGHVSQVWPCLVMFVWFMCHSQDVSRTKPAVHERPL